MTDAAGGPLKRTALFDLHVELGAKIVPFAGYEMPVQYPAGILAEHQHTRTAAGLFDVSHMGQLRIDGDNAATAVETLVPGDIQALGEGRMRYTQLTNESGGILDDLMVTRRPGHLFVVVNAAGKDADLAHIQAAIGGKHEVTPLFDRGLLALQGPKAVDVLARHAGEGVRNMPFMSLAEARVGGVDVILTRSGYTGEDGFEISMPGDRAEAIARLLLAEPEVKPIGLGARDSLRLEAGLCLYGHDIDTTTTPIEAGLAWSIGKRRREEGGFPGDAVVKRQLANGVTRKRVGIAPEGRVVAREHTEIVDQTGNKVGELTSGGFGPTVGAPIGMGYVATEHAQVGMDLGLVVRGQARPGKVAKMPFVQPGYYRG